MRLERRQAEETRQVGVAEGREQRSDAYMSTPSFRCYSSTCDLRRISECWSR